MYGDMKCYITCDMWNGIWLNKWYVTCYVIYDMICNKTFDMWIDMTCDMVSDMTCHITWYDMLRNMWH